MNQDSSFSIPPWFYPGLLPPDEPPMQPNRPMTPPPPRPMFPPNSNQPMTPPPRPMPQPNQNRPLPPLPRPMPQPNSNQPMTPPNVGNHRTPIYPLETPNMIILPSMDSFSRDYRYLESMYPELLRRLRFAIQEELELVKQEGSFLYDEYPDKLSLRRFKRHLVGTQSELAEEFAKKGCPAEWFEAFVELLLTQQLLELRRQYRKQRF